VISVPAYFGEKERQSVKHAAEMAGIEVVGLINEPTAAILAYGLNERQGDRLVLVPDFGGGTFDVSVTKFEGTEATVLASGGDKRLGGKDVDDVIMNMALEQFKKEHGLELSPQSHPADWFTLWEHVVRQKQMLSSRQEVKVCARVDGKQVVVALNRHLLADAIKPLLDRIER